MNIKNLEKIAEKFDVRVSSHREDRKTVYGLHGFLRNIEAMEKEIHGFWVEKMATGHYLYRETLSWN